MSLTRRHLLLAASGFPCLAFAQAARAPHELKDFRPVTPPQPVENGSKIEVLEFFQYTCQHCMSYEPVLEGWRKRLAADVEYRRIPISWDQSNLPHVRIYYTLEVLGKVN